MVQGASSPVAIASPTITSVGGGADASDDDDNGSDPTGAGGDDTTANAGLAAATGFNGLTAQTAATPVAGAGGVLSTTTADLAAQMAAKLSAGASRFQLQLNPEGLGRVDVQVTIGVDREVRAQLSFADPAVAGALHAHAAELQGALQQAGFNVAADGMHFTAHASGAQFAAGGGLGFGAGSNAGSGGGQSSGGGANGGAGAALASAAFGSGETAATGAYGVGAGAGQLDIRI